ncbi:hypothetical protein [Litchfieldella rifensis]|uniref:Uncharacterized protein n=1 Tax=Litchfieldella rifensis TaxID=762643 RepID=A0ABV7LSI2_9GAMM
MIDLTPLTLLPQEQLVLASTHENQEMYRYRRLALSFLPNATYISRLMAALGSECEQRLDTLGHVAERLGLSACLTTTEARNDHSLPATAAQRHFFITDDVMADQTLKQALEAAHHSRHFSDRLLETNATPELHEPFLTFARQKHVACRVLQECQEQWRLASGQRPRPEEAHHRARVARLNLSTFG